MIWAKKCSNQVLPLNHHNYCTKTKTKLYTHAEKKILLWYSHSLFGLSNMTCPNPLRLVLHRILENLSLSVRYNNSSMKILNMKPYFLKVFLLGNLQVLTNFKING